MTLRAIAEKDLGKIMESTLSFRTPVTVTDPDGNTNTNTLYAFTGDISALIDPDTGQAVSGRSAVAAIRTSSLVAEGLGYPVGVANSNSKPWTVAFDDISGDSHLFKVIEGNPDRTLGIVNLTLEIYRT